VRAARAAGREPEPTDLGEERAVNPFLRPGSAAVLDALRRRGVEATGPREAFVALRGLRDRF